MRLWSVHPGYLDVKGLVAAWREGLLTQKVLSGATRGYRNHPQFARFKAEPDPLRAIGSYLHEVYREASKRGYRFDIGKVLLMPSDPVTRIGVNEGQALYEFELLRYKLKGRDPLKYGELEGVDTITLNGAFSLRSGGIEEWERVIPEIREICAKRRQ